MKVFILEDNVARIQLFRESLMRHDVTHAVDVPAAMAKWHPPYDVVLFDHDLGDEVMVPSSHANTGAAFARRVVGTLTDETCIVHSYNQDGAKVIMDVLGDAGIVAPWTPFGPNLLAWLAAL